MLAVVDFVISPRLCGEQTVLRIKSFTLRSGFKKCQCQTLGSSNVFAALAIKQQKRLLRHDDAVPNALHVKKSLPDKFLFRLRDVNND